MPRERKLKWEKISEEELRIKQQTFTRSLQQKQINDNFAFAQKLSDDLKKYEPKKINSLMEASIRDPAINQRYFNESIKQFDNCCQQLTSSLPLCEQPQEQYISTSIPSLKISLEEIETYLNKLSDQEKNIDYLISNLRYPFNQAEKTQQAIKELDDWKISFDAYCINQKKAWDECKQNTNKDIQADADKLIQQYEQAKKALIIQNEKQKALLLAINFDTNNLEKSSVYYNALKNKVTLYRRLLQPKNNGICDLTRFDLKHIILSKIEATRRCRFTFAQLKMLGESGVKIPYSTECPDLFQQNQSDLQAIRKYFSKSNFFINFLLINLHKSPKQAKIVSLDPEQEKYARNLLKCLCNSDLNPIPELNKKDTINTLMTLVDIQSLALEFSTLYGTVKMLKILSEKHDGMPQKTLQTIRNIVHTQLDLFANFEKKKESTGLFYKGSVVIITTLIAIIPSIYYFSDNFIFNNISDDYWRFRASLGSCLIPTAVISVLSFQIIRDNWLFRKEKSLVKKQIEKELGSLCIASSTDKIADIRNTISEEWDKLEKKTDKLYKEEFKKKFPPPSGYIVLKRKTLPKKLLLTECYLSFKQLLNACDTNRKLGSQLICYDFFRKETIKKRIEIASHFTSSYDYLLFLSKNAKLYLQMHPEHPSACLTLNVNIMAKTFTDTQKTLLTFLNELACNKQMQDFLKSNNNYEMLSDFFNVMRVSTFFLVLAKIQGLSEALNTVTRISPFLLNKQQREIIETTRILIGGLFTSNEVYDYSITALSIKGLVLIPSICISFTIFCASFILAPIKKLYEFHENSIAFVSLTKHPLYINRVLLLEDTIALQSSFFQKQINCYYPAGSDLDARGEILNTASASVKDLEDKMNQSEIVLNNTGFFHKLWNCFSTVPSPTGQTSLCNKHP